MLESIKEFIQDDIACETLSFTPRWKDQCRHEHGAFIASFSVFELRNGKHVEEKHDLYVFNDRDGQSVCLRYGDEPQQYASPGRVGDFIKSASLHGSKLPSYERALRILSLFGRIGWKRTYDSDGNLINGS